MAESKQDDQIANGSNTAPDSTEADLADAASSSATAAKAPSGPGPAYVDHQFRSNAHTGPRKTPSIPDGGKWSVYAECNIRAPPQYPYEAIVEIHDWPQWNSWVPDVLVTKHPHPHRRRLRMEQGTFMTFTVQMTPTERTQSREVCLHLEALKTRHDGRPGHDDGRNNITRIRWTLDNANLLTPAFVIKTERVNEIEEASGADDACKYRTWITFTGLAAKSVKKKYGAAIQARVADFCDDLKKRSEEMYRKDLKEQRQQEG